MLIIQLKTFKEKFFDIGLGITSKDPGHFIFYYGEPDEEKKWKLVFRIQ